MTLQTSSARIDVAQEKIKLKELYKANKKKEKFHGLVIGAKGAGKTTLFETLPKPLYLFSFDPGGTVVLKESIDCGDIIADTRYEDDDPRDPRSYRDFLETYRAYGKSGFFENFASVGIDSLTPMGQSMLWWLMKKENRLPDWTSNAPTNQNSQGMRIQDWGTVVNLWIMQMKSMNSLPCHTLVTGHIDRTLDAVYQTFVKHLFLPGQSKDNVPNLTPEVYYLLTGAMQGDGQVKRWLLTQNNGEYQASTRMGRKGRLSIEEKPDIRAMLKKCGLDYEDKEAFLTAEDLNRV